MRSLKDVTDYVRWRSRGRPPGTTPPQYGPWMDAYDDILSPSHDPIGRISVICPVFDTPPAFLMACIASVEAQTYQDRELILIDDRSTDDGTLEVLASVADRPGIRVVRADENLGIAGATNRGVETASGEYITFLDHDDLLRPEALEWLNLGLTDADVVYSDEDQLTPDGDRTYPFMKPAWSPRLLLGMNYVNHITAIRRDAVLSVGAIDDTYSGAQDHDLLLRLAEAGARITHIPKVLYHWRQSPRSVAGDVDVKPWALDSAMRTVAAAVERRHIDANVIDAQDAGPYRFTLDFRSTSGSIEIVDGDSSAALNRASRESTADIIVLAHSGTTLSNADQLQLAGWLADQDVVAVGPKILNEDGSVREAGWIVSGGEARAYGFGVSNSPLPFLEVARESSAIGGDLLAIRREQFLEAGGLDESLPLSLAGVQLSHRLAEARNGVCVVEPAVITTVPTTEAWTESLPIQTRLSQDPFVSPHKTINGMTIDTPPPHEERLQRLLPRSSRGPRTVDGSS